MSNMTENRVKRHKNGNEYVLVAGNIWIRNFAKAAPFIDINELTSASDRKILIENQLKNQSTATMQLDVDSLFRPNICIVSDGWKFSEKQKLLKSLPGDVTIIGTNKSLAKWDLKLGKTMSYYVVNNPYEACMSFLPSTHRYFPPCVSSIRTYPNFIESYHGEKFMYVPTFEEGFSQKVHMATCRLDDYRNPICAAISLAYRMKASKILLFCCDDSFADERPGVERLANGLWTYPQHLRSHAVIEGNLHWLAKQPHKTVKIGNHSSGPEYSRIPYIPEESLGGFFTEE